MKFLTRLLISALAVLIGSYMLPGVEVDNMFVALLVAAVLAFLNAVLKPLLILLTIPITLFTFGLFLVVINALIILAADYLVDGFSVKGFWYALLFSVTLSLITSILNMLMEGNRRHDVNNNG